MKLQLAHFNSLISLVTYFNNDKRCRDFITEQRWGGNVVCTFCGYIHAHVLSILIVKNYFSNTNPILEHIT
jgi:hypothetical protein